MNGVDNLKFQPIIRRLDNIQVSITPYHMTPLNKVTNQVLSQMQSFQDYSEINGPSQAPIRVLDNLDDELHSGQDDVTKLESIFKRLVSNGKMNKK